MGGAELRGSCEDYFDDISYLLFVTDCRRLNTHFRPIAAGSDYMLYPAFGWCGGARVAQLLVEGGPVDDQGRYGLATRSAKVPARSAGASGATVGGAGSFYVRTGVLDWTRPYG